MCERDGNKGLHIAGAAAKQAAVMFNDAEGVGIPWLSIYGHNVGVAREHDAAGLIRANGGVEIRLAAVGVGN